MRLFVVQKFTSVDTAPILSFSLTAAASRLYLTGRCVRSRCYPLPSPISRARSCSSSPIKNTNVHHAYSARWPAVPSLRASVTHMVNCVWLITCEATKNWKKKKKKKQTNRSNNVIAAFFTLHIVFNTCNGFPPYSKRRNFLVKIFRYLRNGLQLFSNSCVIRLASHKMAPAIKYQNETSRNFQSISFTPRIF